MELKESFKAEILLIEDELSVIDMMREVLTDEGYEVYAAIEGIQGIEIAKNKIPDLILLDIQMPGIDGFEVCTTLKADVELKEIPVIFTSGLADPSDKVKAFDAGGVDYITKPIENVELLARLNIHLSINRLQNKLKKTNIELEEKVKKRTEELENTNKILKDSEERYRTIFQESADAIMILDENEFLDCNRAALTLLGYDNKEDFIGRKPSEISPPLQPGGIDSETSAREKIIKAYERGNNSFEWVHRRADGTDFYAEVSLTSFKYKDKLYLQSIMRDVSDRKMFEESLRLSEEKFSRAFMVSPMGMLIAGLEDEKIIDWNDRAYEISGYSQNEVIGRRMKDFDFYADPQDRKNIAKLLSRDGRVRDFEFKLTTRSGEVKLGSLSLEIVEIEGKLCTISMVVDITEERELQQEMMKLIEVERRSIGQDLHDDLGQVLTGASFMAQSLKQEIIETGSPGRESAEKIDELIRNAVSRTRSISRMLTPVDISSDGFVSALIDMAENIRKIFNISCEVIVDDEFELDNNTGTNIYYIVRESINNALKHGKAEGIDIILRKNGGKYNILISDNGSGADLSETSTGIGLRVIKYRANLIGAVAQFITAVNEGFTVNITGEI